MITGFQVVISAAEMKSHLHARATHHREKGVWYEYESQYESQKAQFADAPTAQMTNDPVKSMQEAGKRHEGKAAWFTFMADHIPAGESYQLSDHDLERLELVSAKGY